MGKIDSSRILIQFVEERVARVSISETDFVLVGVLLDLPSAVETLRTFDRSTYCKVADISQILHCFVLAEGWSLNAVEKIVAPFRRLRWRASDGLTPPLKGMRGPLEEKSAIEIEKAVEELLSKDAGCISSRFSLFDDVAGCDSTKPVLRGVPGGKLLYGDEDVEMEADGDEEGEGAADGDTIPEDDAEYMDDLTETTTITAVQDDDEDDDDFAAELEEQMMAEDDSQKANLRAAELLPEIKEAAGEGEVSSIYGTNSLDLELHNKIKDRKAQLQTITNPLIRARLEDVIRQLEIDLENRMKQSM